MNPLQWREAMQTWALPESILAAAPESPWGFPIEPFRTRVERAKPGHLTFGNRRALEALPERGTVLDIGVGSGAASLPLHTHCSLIVGVDSAAPSLAEFRRQTRRVGVAARTVQGAWPDVERRTPVADVVVCNHVAYNVGDLAPFVLALDAHARKRVVMEITRRHPTAWMADLWLLFHRLERPERPDAFDAASLIRGLGLPVRRHSARQAHGRRAAPVASRDATTPWRRSGAASVLTRAATLKWRRRLATGSSMTTGSGRFAHLRYRS